jgi:tRNA A-37 threonylcarbamoyl transferase component Bud32/predicted hydrocarbon binding protein
MHGIIFNGLKSFVENKLGAETWLKLLSESDISRADYKSTEAYPDAELRQIVATACRLTGGQAEPLLEEFGAYLARGLMKIYKVLINPQWKSLDLFEHVETTIHEVVRARNPGARPPQIKAFRTDSKQVKIIYASPRRFCHVLKGVIQGVANFYGETIECHETRCMHNNDSHCEMIVTKSAAPTRTNATGAYLSKAQSAIKTRSYKASQPLQNQRFGRYKVIGLLGRGAMGIVYKALDPTLEREVALKVLLKQENSYDKELAARFYQEAKVIARLHHRSIVQIHDIGEEQGLPYFVMEFIAGESFDCWLKKSKKRPALHILEILQELARALAKAHKTSIIHRDVKPQNVIINAQGYPMLMDFGIAKNDAVESGLTKIGQVLGTPQYMSPEQFEGIQGLVGATTDIYALGAMLYFALCGQAPFVATSLTAIVRMVLLKDPKAPRTINKDISPELEEIILCCLEKDSKNRFQSAEEFADALQIAKKSL